MATAPMNSDYSGNTFEIHRMRTFVEVGSSLLKLMTECTFKPTAVASAMLLSKGGVTAPSISVKLLGPSEGYMTSVLSSK
jgi:hypothetical protein